ncbi:MAG: Hsp20 family protein [Blastocatellia bacterium]
MATQQALQPIQQKTASSPIFVEAEKLFEQMKDFSQSIGRRAFEFFEARGREFGHDLEDWLRAETELMRRVPVEMKETEKQIAVRAEVPGFNANEIKISVEPKWLVLSGKTEKQTGENEGEKVYSEFRSNQFYRELTLPAEVDPAKTTATLKHGVLELTLARTPVGQPVNVEVKAA